MILRGARTIALWAIAVLIGTASGAAFAESYRGLLAWALRHGLAGFWAACFPLQLDLFIAVGELVLFVAMVDGWKVRSRTGAWAVSLTGLAVSVAGNIGHLAVADVQSRATAAVPPLAAFAALWLGLSVLKRIMHPDPGAPGIPDADVPPDDEDTVPETDPLMVSAEAAYPDVVYGVQEIPSLRSIRATLKIGDAKAARVREHLGKVRGSTRPGSVPEGGGSGEHDTGGGGMVPGQGRRRLGLGGYLRRGQRVRHRVGR